MLKRALLIVTLIMCGVAGTIQATPSTHSAFSAAEQHKVSVSGRVLDHNGTPIPYANVSLRKASGEVYGSGVISDDKGGFSFKSIPSGDYVAVVAFLGYVTVEKPFVVSGKNISLGDITLKEDAQAIDKVEVTGMRSQMQFDIDKRVFNVDQNIAATGGSASDILNNIPSVEVDGDGEVSLRGNASVTVWINGKESGITADNRAQILEQMPAETIEKIEIITNPSAKFSPEGTSGIINIVLKESHSSGYYGGVQATIDSRLGGNVGGNINYSSRIADFYVNLGYRRHVRTSGSLTERKNLDADGNELSWLNTREEGSGAGNNGFARLGATFHLTKKDDLGFAGFGMLGGRDNDEKTFYEGNVPGSYNSAHRITDGGNKMMGGHLELNYRHKFGTDHTLDALVAYDAWRMNNSNDYLQESFYTLDTTRSYQRQESKMQNGGWTAQIDYLNKINDNHRIEAGYKGTFNSDNSPATYLAGESADNLTPLYALYNDYYYKQNINALYVNYAGKVNFRGALRSLGYQAGVRGEYTQMKTRSLGHNPTPEQQAWYSKNYFKAFPSLFVSMSFRGDHELQVNYTRRIERPRGHQLNSFRNLSDSTNISYGNPYLNPQNGNAFEINYIKTWENHVISVSAYYRSTDDVIQRINYLDGNVMMSTFANVARREAAGVELVAKNKLWTRLDLTTTINLYYSGLSDWEYIPYEGATPITGKGNSSFAWDARLVANLMLPKGFSFQVTGGYNSRRVSAQGYSLGNYFVDAGVRKSIGKWAIAINCRDIFNSRGRRNISEGVGFSQTSKRWWGGRRVRITASYSFGNMKPVRNKNNAQMSEGGDMGGFEGMEE